MAGERVERRLAVRGVQGLAPPVGLPVDQPTRSDEGGHIGDGVEDPVAAFRPAEGHRLVEVGAVRRVDGEERDVGEVLASGALASAFTRQRIHRVRPGDLARWLVKAF